MTGHHHTFAPSAEGTVMLTVGAGIGALIIHTTAVLLGHEIEVSRVTEPATRKHAAVRARHVRDGVTYCVVIDGLTAGRYVVWRDPAEPAGEIDVRGGAVAEFTWPTEAGAV